MDGSGRGTDTGAEDAHGLRSERFRQFKNGGWRDLEDVVALEKPLRLHWPGQPTRRLLAYPDGDHAWRLLALGHALLDICAPGERPVLLGQEGEDFHLAPEAMEPERQAGQAKEAVFAPMSAEELLRRMGEFIHAAGRWEHTGCFHRMALFSPREGRFLVQVEDIGRHNCLDRLAGFCLEQGLAPRGLALFASARATGSLVAKAVRAGFALLISRSAVTTDGLLQAREGDLTLLGFAREIRFTVFIDPKGLVRDPGQGEEARA